MKELNLFHDISSHLLSHTIARASDVLGVLTMLLPALQRPDSAYAHASLRESKAQTENFRKTPWRLIYPLDVNGETVGRVEIGYLKPPAPGEAFSPEERMLVQATVAQITVALEREQASANLAGSELQYRWLSEEVPDVIFRLRLAPALQMEYVSHSFTTMLGYTPDEIYRNSSLILDMVHPEDRPRIENNLTAQTLERPEPARVFHKDGHLVWLEPRVHVLTDQDDQPVLMEGILRDITARKQAEQAKDEAFVLTEALRNTALMLSSTLDLDIIFDRLLANLQRVVPSDAADIMLIDKGVARIVRCRGYAERGLEETVLGLTFPLDKFPHMREAIKNGQPQYMPDTHREPDWLPLEESRWIHSHMVAPIRSDNDVIGFINVDSATPDRYTTQDIERLQTFADQAAVAIRNARLYSAEREARLQQEALRDTVLLLSSTLDLDVIFARLLANVQRVVPMDAANIMLIEGDIARVVRQIGLRPERTDDNLLQVSFRLEDLPHLQKAIATKQAQCVTDTSTYEDWQILPETAWIKSYLVAPIRAGHTVIGFLNVDSATPGTFSAQDAEHLQAFADQAAVAIRNAKLYAAERDTRKLNEAMREITAVLTSEANLEDVLKHILATVKRVIPYDAANIMLIKDDMAKMAFLNGYPPELLPFFESLQLPVMETPNLRELVLRRRPVLIADTRQNDEWQQIEISKYIFSYLGAPIQLNGKVIAMISLDSAVPNFFTEAQAERLQFFADKAAIAIQNARLYDQIRSHADELEERVHQRTLELFQEKEQAEAVLNSSSDAIVLVSPDGLVQEHNSASNHLVAPHRNGDQPVAITALVIPDQRAHLTDALAAVVEHKRAQRIEVETLIPGGAGFQADLALSPVLDLDRQVSRVVCSFRDITTRKQMEAHLHRTLERETDLNEAKSRLVTVVSHELRTSLAVMQTSIDLIARYSDRLTPQERQEEQEQIRDGVRRMTRLINDVLTFDHFEASGNKLDVTTFDLVQAAQAAVEQTSQSLAPNLSQRLQVITDADAISVEADGHFVQQIIQNLLSNAVNYSSEDSPITLTLTDHADHVAIQVRDQGVGIPADEQGAVFDMFFRASNVISTEGSGLGLTVVKRATDMLGGAVVLDSTENGGTTVTITLPRIVTPQVLC